MSLDSDWYAERDYQLILASEGEEVDIMSGLVKVVLKGIEDMLHEEGARPLNEYSLKGETCQHCGEFHYHNDYQWSTNNWCHEFDCDQIPF